MPDTLRDFVSINGRFHRSVSLIADWNRQDSLEHYLPTVTVHRLADFVVSELNSRRGARAWSITGPYGSGKSAFGLYLADALARRNPSHAAAALLRRRHRLGSAPFVPVLVSAERGPLAPLVHDALSKAMNGSSLRSRKGDVVGSDLGGLLLSAARLAKRRRRAGLLLIIDELGKYLEFAALHPKDGDVFLLQQLAEAAARSEVPALFVTILHSGFADYLPANEEVRRAEWQKVQGRFHDVPFQLPAEQVLELVGSAIKVDAPRSVTRAWESELNRIKAASCMQEVGNRRLLRILKPCFPLHPMAALLLWPLFRSKGAQNERSLFGFLATEEPLGLQDFLRSTRVDEPSAMLYRLPQLYDYILTALGLGAFRGDQARKWALVDAALARLPATAPAVCVDVVKSIGLLGIYGQQVGLAASKECVQLALGPKARVNEACEFLLQHSLVVYRRHIGAFAIWEGSDFDIDGAREEAFQRVASKTSLAERVKQVMVPRPLVPRAHYIRSGTLRFFEPRLMDGTPHSLEQAFRSPTNADGRVLFVFPAPGQDRTDLARFASELSGTTSVGGVPVILGVPDDVAGIESELEEFEIWNWVSSSKPELQGDPIARQEVRARLLDARRRILRRMGPIIGLSGGPLSPKTCTWIQGGHTRRIKSAVAFQRWISDLCDEAFSQAPRFRNELLNRSTLSSAASAARRNLLQRMLTHGSEPRLGIEGAPPEASMYESMLRHSGIHREIDGRWQFAEPRGEWKQAWKVVELFLKSANVARRSVTELIDVLKLAPLGMKDGPIPVLLCAVLLSKGEEVALYEEGVFVPELRIEVIERLLRRPETFEVRSHVLSESQSRTVLAVMRAGREAALASDEHGRTSLLSVVKSLVLFAHGLPPYTRQTRRLADPATALVRDQLLTATEPARLLFEELPAACSVVELRRETVAVFVDRLIACLRALARAYPALLDEIEIQIRTVLGLSAEPGAPRRQLQQRAEIVLGFVAEPKLEVFVREAARDSSLRDWREGIARAVGGGMPPSHWKDTDASGFQLRLREVASEFLRLEELAAEQRKTGAPRVLRFGMLDASRPELRAVIPIRDERDTEVEGLVERIGQALGANPDGSADYRRTQLEALGRVAAGLLLDGAAEEVAR